MNDFGFMQNEKACQEFDLKNAILESTKNLIISTDKKKITIEKPT
jgi:hypothetical protein